MPTKPDNGGGNEGSAKMTTLEEFLIACQKSLARAVRNAQQAGRSDNEFAQGERPLYMIDGLEIDLSAGLSSSGSHGNTPDRIHLDFESPAADRSRVRFRVETKPMEVQPGARLQLVNLSVPGEDDPDARLRIWLANDEGAPVPDYPVNIYLARAGTKLANLRKPIGAKTDIVGRVDFTVDTRDHFVKIVGDRRRHKAFLSGDGREYFVWATVERAAEWTNIVEPPPPHPPLAIERDAAGLPKEL